MKSMFTGAVLAIVALAAVAASSSGQADKPAYLDNPNLATATFAGGCFWCTEADFEKVPGVVDAVSGYTGGKVANPTYRQVSSGTTGHLEAVRVYYDPAKISYEGLLEAFWRMINPTDAGGQFVDRGMQYTTAIFYHDAKQKQAAEESKARLAASGRFGAPLVTPIVEAGEFYVAEEYHQNYHDKNPLRYKFYRYGSGRDQYLEKTWGSALEVDYAQFAPERS